MQMFCLFRILFLIFSILTSQIIYSAQTEDDPLTRWANTPNTAADEGVFLSFAALTAIFMGSAAWTLKQERDCRYTLLTLGLFGTLGAMVSGFIWWMTSSDIDDVYVIGSQYAPTELAVFLDWQKGQCESDWDDDDIFNCVSANLQTIKSPGMGHMEAKVDDDVFGTMDIPIFDGRPMASFDVKNDEKIHASPGSVTLLKDIHPRLPSRELKSCSWIIDKNQTRACDLDNSEAVFNFEQPGNYSVQLNAKDDHNGEGESEEKIIRLERVPPNVRLLCGFSNLHAYPTKLACMAKAEPNGDGVQIENYEWILDGQIVSGDLPQKFSKTYTTEGNEGLVLRVTDSQGQITRKTYEILVNPNNKVTPTQIKEVEASDDN